MATFMRTGASEKGFQLTIKILSKIQYKVAANWCHQVV